MPKRGRNLLRRAALHVLAMTCRAMGPRMMRLFARLLASLWPRLEPERLEITRHHLEGIGIVDPGARKEVLANCVEVVLGLLASYRVPLSRLTCHIGLDGAEHVRRALREGHGCILFSAHFGNWELGGARIAAEGFSIAAPYRALRNHEVDAFVARLRRDFSLQLYDAGKAVRVSTASGPLVLRLRGLEQALMGALRQNRIVYMLVDQVFARRTVTVEFCGRSVSFPRGPAAMAMRTNAAMIPVYWDATGTEPVVRILPPLPVATGVPRRRRVQELSQQMVACIEGFVRRDPLHWSCVSSRCLPPSVGQEPRTPARRRPGQVP